MNILAKDRYDYDNRKNLYSMSIRNDNDMERIVHSVGYFTKQKDNIPIKWIPYTDTDNPFPTSAFYLKKNIFLDTVSISVSNIELLKNFMPFLDKILPLMKNTLSISFDKCDIGESGSYAVARALKGMPFITSVYFHSTKLGDNGTIRIAEALTSHKLRILHITDNLVGETGAKKIAEILKNSTDFNDISFYGNEITDDGATAIVTSLLDNTNLYQIDLANNPMIGEKCAIILENLILKNKRLNELHIHDTGIGDETVAALHNRMTKKTSFKDSKSSYRLITLSRHTRPH